MLNLDELEITVPEIFGVASPVRFYKLAWHLQQLRIFKVEIGDDLKNEVNNGLHSAYYLNHLDEQSTFAIIKNKGSLGYYYKLYKDFDYLLLSLAEGISVDNDSLTSIRNLDCVSLCHLLDKPSAPEDMNFIQLL